MARIEIDGQDLVVRIEGAHKLWALKSEIRVSLAHVRGATADPGIVREAKGLRAPGTHVPGVIVAGTFHQDGERVFWDVQDGERAVVVQLQDEPYARLVLEVDDPRATVGLVTRAVAARG